MMITILSSVQVTKPTLIQNQLVTCTFLLDIKIHVLNILYALGQHRMRKKPNLRSD